MDTCHTLTVSSYFSFYKNQIFEVILDKIEETSDCLLNFFIIVVDKEFDKTREFEEKLKFDNFSYFNDQKEFHFYGYINLH